MNTRKLTTLGLLSAIALTIFMVEAQIPPIVPLPGVKVGLANIVTVFAVFVLGAKEGAAVLFVRIFLGAVFAGNFSTIFYSAAGGCCAILATIGVRRILTKKQLKLLILKLEKEVSSRKVMNIDLKKIIKIRLLLMILKMNFLKKSQKKNLMKFNSNLC